MSNTKIIMNYLELKATLIVGFLSGYIPNYHMDYTRILSSIVGTVAAGIVWIFLKPIVLKFKIKINQKLKKQCNNYHKE